MHVMIQMVLWNGSFTWFRPPQHGTLGLDPLSLPFFFQPAPEFVQSPALVIRFRVLPPFLFRPKLFFAALLEFLIPVGDVGLHFGAGEETPVHDLRGSCQPMLCGQE